MQTRSRLRGALELLIDERLVLAVITFNMFVLFLRGFRQMQRYDDLLFALDYLCLCYFFFEIALKIHLWGWRAFWARSMNRFDFLIVLASAPTFFTAFTPFHDETSVLLVLRGGRLLRFLRLLRFIPHADQLWSGIARALRASVGLILAIMLYNLVLGLIASHLFMDVAPAHFGDPLASVYTIFKVFTIEGWYEIPDEVARTGSPLMATALKGFFVFAVITGGLLGMSLTNAVLVDEMVIDNTHDLEEAVATLRAEVARLESANHRLLHRLDEQMSTMLALQREATHDLPEPEPEPELD